MDCVCILHRDKYLMDEFFYFLRIQSIYFLIELIIYKKFLQECLGVYTSTSNSGVFKISLNNLIPF